MIFLSLPNAFIALFHSISSIHPFIKHFHTPISYRKRKLGSPYLGASNNKLNLAAGGAHELGELGDDAGEETETVVLGQGGEEVLEGGAGSTRGLLELGNDAALVGGSQAGGAEDGDQLGVLLDDGAELLDRLGSRLEGRGLDGGRVLFHYRTE